MHQNIKRDQRGNSPVSVVPIAFRIGMADVRTLLPVMNLEMEIAFSISGNFPPNLMNWFRYITAHSSYLMEMLTANDMRNMNF